MKNVLLVLVLANILLLAWHRWITPREVAPRAGTTVPTLILMTGRGDPGAASPARENTRNATRRCARIGPFVDAGQASAAGLQLTGAGYSVAQTSREGRVWVGHWVQIDHPGSRGDAGALLKRLIKGGLGDAYIVETEGTRRISLGVFRDESRAEHVAAQAARLGTEPTISDRYRPATEYWLQVASERGAPDLSRLQLETSRILRSEPVDCG